MTRLIEQRRDHVSKSSGGTKFLSCFPLRIFLLVLMQGLIGRTDAQSTLPKAVHDSLWAVWNDTGTADSSRFKAMYKLVWDGYVQSQPDSAIYYAHLMETAAKRKGLKKEIATALNLEGNAVYNQGDYDKSMEVHLRSLSIRMEIGDQDGISRSLLNIGNCYRHKNEQRKALWYLQKSLAIKREIKDDEGIAICLNNMGIAYKSLGETDKAMDLYEQSLAIRERLGDEKGIAYCLGSIGLIHKQRGQFKEAIACYSRAVELHQKVGNTKGAMDVLGYWATLCRDGGDIPGAIGCYGRSLRLAISTHNTEAMNTAMSSLVSMYLKQGADARAFALLDRMLRMNEALGDTLEMAAVCEKIGDAYQSMGDYASAIPYFSRSLVLYEVSGDTAAMTGSLQSLGSIIMEQGDHVRALAHYHRALQICTALKDQECIARFNNQIGLVHMRDGDNEQAITYFTRCKTISESISELTGIAVALDNLGIVHRRMGHIEEALEMHLQALRILEQGGSKASLAYTTRSVGHLYATKGDHQKAMAYGERALALARNVGDITVLKDVSDLLYTSYKATGQLAKALEMHELNKQMHDSIGSKAAQREAIRYEFKYAFEKKQALAKAEQERKEAVAAEALRRKSVERNAFIGGFGLMVLLAGVFFTQRNRISKERKRSEGLLLNILPSEVAEELKDTGAAKAKHYAQATILFSDFKGFTQASERMSPQELVEELNVCFKAFDGIITARGIEKIKTIGDAYMCVGGLPDPRSSSPRDVVHAALEMQAFMQQRRVERDAQGLPAFEMRVGIHTGPVVAGIVGVKKFQYDIWGDTVNIASRMESSGEVGQVNISEATYALVKEEPGFFFTSRGKVQAKGKGEMEMYFVGKRA